MTYSIYDSFSIEDVENIGATFQVKCIANRGMENHLTIGKMYQIEIIEPILPMSPLCELIGDTGKSCGCHLSRFEKIAEVSYQKQEVK